MTKSQKEIFIDKVEQILSNKRNLTKAQVQKLSELKEGLKNTKTSTNLERIIKIFFSLFRDDDD